MVAFPALLDSASILKTVGASPPSSGQARRAPAPRSWVLIIEYAPLFHQAAFVEHPTKS
jgi:hypothetical protein